ncbi:hypothetical protein BJ508DRAFT_313348 [Ascobolus immersus RN42]|uniref:Uncharacterized protein n=1 Tax=Ascobolus immersus RN42 TaxID=1160509 RepID=A0A3N4HQ00_ASCIM|nr:hypothetical protein BJ508DRAFT_313348 [Ascobolus immersus RN42]
MAPYHELIQQSTPEADALKEFIAAFNKGIHTRYPYYRFDVKLTPTNMTRTAVGNIIKNSIDIYDFPVPLADRNSDETFTALQNYPQLRLPAATLERLRKQNEELGVGQFEMSLLLEVKIEFGRKRYWQGLCMLYPDLEKDATYE